MSAQKARGADLESGGLTQRAKALIPILIPLFVSSFRRADDLALAMELSLIHISQLSCAAPKESGSDGL